MTMLLFRAVQKRDLDNVHTLAMQSGVGITTLSKSRDVLQQRIALSIDSFQKSVTHPGNEYYFFVLEDPTTQAIVGTSAIEASLGSVAPFFNYKLSKRTRISEQIGIRSDASILNLVNDNQNKSELCTLYLQPDYRHSHHGLFLSRARFLYMAQNPKRFEPKVIAEMRGVVDEQGNSPFWNNVGLHFFQISFENADALTMSVSKQFIVDLLPEHPILVQLLNQEAQEVIGKAHQASIPAMRILMKEGFHLTDYVDIFDAGPTLEANLSNIKTISESTLATVSGFEENIDDKETWMIANTFPSIRATNGPAIVQGNNVILNKKIAELLHVKHGDLLRLTLLLGKK